MLAQGNVDVRAGNFLMLCAVSAVVFAAVAFFAGGNILFGWAGALARVFSSLRLRLAHAHQALSEI